YEWVPARMQRPERVEHLGHLFRREERHHPVRRLLALLALEPLQVRTEVHEALRKLLGLDQARVHAPERIDDSPANPIRPACFADRADDRTDLLTREFVHRNVA